MAVGRASFLDVLRQSQLLEPAQLDQLTRLPPAQRDDPKALAQAILQRGWLTRFQLTMLAQGKGKELVLGPYRLLDRIGEGAMGQVLKAHHLPMNRTVALKIIRKERLANPDAVKRFYREVQAVAQLAHPNIVIAYDAGQAGSTHYFAMEYVEGVDLARLVKESGPLPIAQACEYTRQAALGLQHAFERGLVHRDIKPHNLLVTQAAGSGDKPRSASSSGTSAKLARKATVKILDMGLARLQGPAEQDHALTKDGAVVGSPEYLAPEQAVDAHSADIRADLYSLGCTFYFLLTGQPPFRGGSLTEMLLKHQMNEAKPLQELRADVPAGVQALVARLMAKRPEDRFQTPAELVEALQPFCEGGSAVAVASAIRAAPGTPAADSVWSSLDENPEGSLIKKSRAGTDDDETLEQAPISRRQRQPAARKRLQPLHWVLIGAGGLVAAAVVVAGVMFLTGKEDRPRPPPNLALTNPPPVTPVEEPATNQEPVEPPEPKPPVKPGPRPKGEPPVPQPGQPQPAPKSDDPVHGMAGNRGGLPAAVFSPDSRRVLSCCDDGNVRLWDAATYQELKRFPLGAQRVGFSRDGRRGYAKGRDSTVHVLDLEGGTELDGFAGPNLPSIAFARSGRRAIFGGVGASVPLWDLETRKELRRFQTLNTPQALALAPDSQRAAAGTNDNNVVVWDARTGEEMRRLPGHSQMIHALAFSPDGRFVLSASNDQTVRLWDVSKTSEVRRFDPGIGPVWSVAWCPDGRRALFGGNQALVLWDVGNDKEVRRFQGFRGLVNHLDVAPDGRAAVVCGLVKNVLLSIVDLPEGDGKATTGPIVTASEKRRPVPSAARQAEAEKLIKELFQDDYAKRTVTDHLALAMKLIDKAAETTDDPTARYVLLREAADLATQAGDVRTAVRAIDETAREFTVDARRLKKTALDKVAGSAAAAMAGKALVDNYLALVDEAVAIDDYEAALALVAPAETAARKANSAALVTLVQGRARQIPEIQRAYAEVKPALEVLKTKPRDPEANLAVGKFLCFMKNDWEKGLPLLAAGRDAALKDVAKKEIEGPVSATEQAEVGDGWFALAEAERGPVKNAMQRRAHYWYDQAVAGLTGFTESKVKKRLESIAELVPDLAPIDIVGEITRFEGHTGEVNSVAYARDGRRILSGSADKTARLWDVTSGKELHRFGDNQAAVRVVTFAPRLPRLIVSTADGLVRVFHSDSFQDLNRIPLGRDADECLVYMPDSRDILSGGADRNLRSTHVEPPGWQSSGHLGPWTSINSIAVSSDGNLALFGTSDGSIRLLDAHTYRELRRLLGHGAKVLSVALARDGRHALSGSADKSFRLWDVLTAREVRRFKGHTGQITAVAFSPDGRRALSGSTDKTVRLWDVKTAKEVNRFEGHTAEITGVAFSPDGRRAVSASADRTVRLWGLPK